MPNLNDLGSAIARRFEQAFAPEGVRGRPSAADWITELAQLQKGLRKCMRHPLHRYPGLFCPWCKIEVDTGAVLFLGPIRPPTGPSDPISLPAFDLAQLRAQLAALDLPTAFEVALPRLAGNAAARARGAGLLGWLSHKIDPTRAARQELAEVDTQIRAVMLRMHRSARIEEAWRAAITVAEYAAQRRHMASHFRGAEQKLMHAFETNALIRFLEGRFIRRATIPGINSPLVIAIASFGFETAADVKRRDVQEVHGIGPVKAAALADWVRLQERSFVHPKGPDDATRTQIRVEQSRIVFKARELDKEIAAGFERTRAELKRIETLRAVSNPDLHRLAARRADLAAEIAAHTGAAPSFERPPPTMVDDRLRASLKAGLEALKDGIPPISSQAGSQYGSAPIRVQGTKNCPKCGSRMVRRKARRGPNAGGYFYGCTTYPSCKGTASYP